MSWRKKWSRKKKKQQESIRRWKRRRRSLWIISRSYRIGWHSWVRTSRRRRITWGRCLKITKRQLWKISNRLRKIIHMVIQKRSRSQRRLSSILARYWERRMEKEGHLTISVRLRPSCWRPCWLNYGVRYLHKCSNYKCKWDNLVQPCNLLLPINNWHVHHK